MSGRLIILPKKSWHPGKRENIEKVLRDERLAVEEAAAARERAREIAQEGIVETLSNKRSAGKKQQKNSVGEKPEGKKRRRKSEDQNAKPSGGKGQGWGATLQHVNLFSDAEREAGKTLGQNADHKREKLEEELKTQQRSGLAPTALGEGSAELKSKESQPWYTQLSASSGALKTAARAIRLGREVTGQEAKEVLRRDEGRKGRADPLGGLFRSSTQAAFGSVSSDKIGKIASSPTPEVRLIENNFELSDRASILCDGIKQKKKSKNLKKGKKDKMKRSRRERKKSDQDNSRSRSGGTANNEGYRGLADTTTGHVRQQALNELRRRRLTREGGERERQIRLLAEREMAGQSLPDERSIAYNNQYNAPAARQNR